MHIEFDPFKIIRQAMRRGGQFCDLYLEQSQSTSISCEEDRIERVSTGIDRGCGIRLIAEHRTYYAYTNETTEPALMELAHVVSAALKADHRADISLKSKDISEGFQIRRRPEEEPLGEKVSLVWRGNQRARGMDPRIRQVRINYRDTRKESLVVNSLGQWVEDVNTYIVYAVHVVAEQDGIKQTGYEPVGGCTGLELFDEHPPESVAEAAAKRALMMLSARPAPGGRMMVVLSSEAGGTMIHEAVGHGLEADLAQEGLSVYTNRLGEEVASPLITVIDDGSLPHKRGSSHFDDEGTPTQRTVLIDKGVLKSYMHDRLSAMKAGRQSTGNGRRESYRHRPIPRMTNTMIAPGSTEPSSIISSVERGLLVKKMGGGQVNTVNGDFVFEVTEGYLIDKGKVGEPVRGATLTGSGPEVIKIIDMVGSDLGFAIGTCGKDGQGVPVSDAQPTLRIPEIVVGGAVK